MSDGACLFCRIAKRELPADVVAEADGFVAFRDIKPQAPVHVLVIPKADIASLNDVTEENAALIGHLFVVARRVAENLKLDNGYRVVINCGRDGGQEVPHLHLHVLGQRRMTWPPG